MIHYIKLQFVHIEFFGFKNEADLDGSRGFGGALPDMKESYAARFALARFAGSSTHVDDQGLVLKHTHKMRRLLALSHPNLSGHSSKKQVNIRI